MTRMTMTRVTMTRGGDDDEGDDDGQDGDDNDDQGIHGALRIHSRLGPGLSSSPFTNRYSP